METKNKIKVSISFANSVYKTFLAKIKKKIQYIKILTASNYQPIQNPNLPTFSLALLNSSHILDLQKFIKKY